METKKHKTFVIRKFYFENYLSDRIDEASKARMEGKHLTAWGTVDDILEALRIRINRWDLNPAEMKLLGELAQIIITYAPKQTYTSVYGDTHSSRGDMLQKLHSINVNTVDAVEWKDEHDKRRTIIVERIAEARKTGGKEGLIERLYQALKYYDEVKPQGEEESEYRDSLLREYNEIIT